MRAHAAEALFESHSDWKLLGPEWFRSHLDLLAETSYRDSTAALVGKLLLRDRVADPGT